MSTLAWIVVSGLVMSAISFIGSATLLLRRRAFDRLVLPLVAIAAGALVGSALFHLLPASVEAMGNGLHLYGLVALGFVTFLVLEQYMHWHHCHRELGAHRPVGYLILVADGLHNLIDGVAIASAFILDVRLGIVTWLSAAAHEVPQEFGDFGILVHSGWLPRQALIYNVVSGLPFLAGGLATYALAGSVDVTLLVPFAAGNFIYIAAADLIPQLTVQQRPADKVELTVCFLVAMAGLFLLAGLE